MPRFERAQGDISQALEVQFENTEIKCLFDQLDGLLDKVLFVAHEGEDHPNGQAVVQCQPSCKIDRDDVLQPKQTVIDACECNLGATKADIGAHHIGVAIEPLGLAVALAIEDLQALNRPHSLDER